MHKDLIARENAIKAFKVPQGHDPLIRASVAIKALNMIPTEMSVRDPVRCKECKYLVRFDNRNLCTNDNGLDEPLLYDFCSNAEREHDE